jgi:hypothetical protein
MAAQVCTVEAEEIPLRIFQVLSNGKQLTGVVFVGAGASGMRFSCTRRGCFKSALDNITQKCTALKKIKGALSTVRDVVQHEKLSQEAYQLKNEIQRLQNKNKMTVWGLRAGSLVAAVAGGKLLAS